MKVAKYNGPYMVPSSGANGLADMTSRYSTRRTSAVAKTEKGSKTEPQLAVHICAYLLPGNGSE